MKQYTQNVHNRLDITFINKEKKEIYVIDIAILNDMNVT